MDAPVEPLWHEFRSRLHAFVRSRVSNDHAADDILQVAFLHMHKASSAGAVPDNPSGWVFTITRNAITDYFRTETSQSRRALAAAAEPSAEPHEPRLEAEEDAATVLAQCVEPLLQSLDSPYREALTMTALEGMTQSAAAKKVGISLSGMKSRVQRGRDRLRDLFETCCAIELDARGTPIAAKRHCESPCGGDDE